jgi:hypothetical protein
MEAPFRLACGEKAGAGKPAAGKTTVSSGQKHLTRRPQVDTSRLACGEKAGAGKPAAGTIVVGTETSDSTTTGRLTRQCPSRLCPSRQRLPVDQTWVSTIVLPPSQDRPGGAMSSGKRSRARVHLKETRLQ